MTEAKNKLAELFAACWRDETLKGRFLADPRSVLEEFGMELPEGVDVKVVENADDRVHITLPMTPPGHAELSDADLQRVAGGGNSWNYQTHDCHSTCPGVITCGGQ